MINIARQSFSHPRQHDAMTLIELLVVISITGVIASLVIPGIMAAREASRRMACSSSLRQQHVALDGFHAAFGSYPHNGGFADGTGVISRSGTFTMIYTYDFALGITYPFGVGASDRKVDEQTGPWCYSILPFIEQQVAYQEVDFKQKQTLFLCPSRARTPSAATQSDSHGYYESGGWAWAKTDYSGNKTMFPLRTDLLSNRDIQDGLSNTIALGEKSFDTKEQRSSSWYWDEPLFAGGSDGTVRDGIKIVSDGPGIDMRKNWGSAHRGGANFVFFDNSIRFLSSEISEPLMTAFLSPDGAESTQLPE